MHLPVFPTENRKKQTVSLPKLQNRRLFYDNKIQCCRHTSSTPCEFLFWHATSIKHFSFPHSRTTHPSRADWRVSLNADCSAGGGRAGKARGEQGGVRACDPHDEPSADTPRRETEVLLLCCTSRESRDKTLLLRRIERDFRAISKKNAAVNKVVRRGQNDWFYWFYCNLTNSNL